MSIQYSVLKRFLTIAFVGWIGYSTVNPQKLRSVTGSITYRF
jgi:hypothetical protein